MMIDWPDSIIRGLILPLVLLLFALARKYLPQNKPLRSEEAIDAARMHPYVTLYMLGMGILIAGLSFFGLREANHLMAARDGSPTLTLIPGMYLWIFFPLFGGLSFAWGTTLWVWSLFAGKEIPWEYAIWSDERSGFQVTAILRWMGWLIALPVGIANVLAVPVHANFSGEGISIGHYAKWSPERHTYADVRQFLVVQGFRARDGSFESQPRIILGFADGKEWDSWTTREDNPVNAAVVAYLSEKLHREPEMRATE